MQCLFCGSQNPGGSDNCASCQKPLPVYGGPEGYAFHQEKGLYYQTTRLSPEEGGMLHTIWFDPVSGEYTQTTDAGEPDGYISQEVISGIATPDSAIAPDSLLFDEMRWQSKTADIPDIPAESNAARPVEIFTEQDLDDTAPVLPAAKPKSSPVTHSLKNTVLPIALGVLTPLVLFVLLSVGHFAGLYTLPFLPNFNAEGETTPSPNVSPTADVNLGLGETPDATTHTPPAETPDTSSETPDAEETEQPSETSDIEETQTPEPIKTPEPQPSVTPAHTMSPDDPESIPVAWADANLEKALRSFLAIPGDPIWLRDLTDIHTLSINGRSITINGWSGTLSAVPSSYADLTHLKGLKTLTLANQGLTSLSIVPLSASLESLTLSNNSLSGVSALSDLTALRYLNLQSNAITAIDGLKNLKSLETLELAANQIKDISVISSLTALKTLTLENNPIEDYSPAEKFGYQNTPKLTMDAARLEEIVGTLKPVFSTELLDNFDFPVAGVTASGIYYLATLEGYNGAVVAYLQDEYMEEPTDVYAAYIELKASAFSSDGSSLTMDVLRATYGGNLTEKTSGGSFEASVTIKGLTVHFIASGTNDQNIKTIRVYDY